MSADQVSTSAIDKDCEKGVVGDEILRHVSRDITLGFPIEDNNVRAETLIAESLHDPDLVCFDLCSG